MPYRLALSREQRSTLPLVDSFLPDCEKNEHSSPFLTCYIPIFRFFLFFFSFLVPRTKVTRLRRRTTTLTIDQSWRNPRGSIPDRSTPPLPSHRLFPSLPRGSMIARVRSSFVDPSPPQLSPSIPRQPRLLVLWRCSRGARRAR